MDTEEESAEPQISVLSAPWVGYVLPIAAFMVFTWIEPRFPANYPWLYTLKVAVVTLVVAIFRRQLGDIRPSGKVVLPAVIVGLGVFAEWIMVDRGVHYPHIGNRAAFDPYQAIPSDIPRSLFLGVRFYGLVLLVPVIEELFWRSFLLRYFTQQEWLKVPQGVFSVSAFALTAAGFALSHSEWLPALICAAAYTLLLRPTRSLFACVLAHVVTNLALGVFVLTTHAWQYW